MKSIYSAAELQEAIDELERKRINQELDIHDHFEGLVENLKPANLVKHTFQDILSSPSARNNLLGSAIGLGSGLLSRKLLVGKSTSILGKTIGSLVQFGVAGVIAKNSEKIKEKAAELIGRIFGRKKRYQPDIIEEEK
ncbi:MAG: hypothetical protein C5B59_05955 [Bacteroidetes bacterium]|nr:MAG: hypothetical protein C5B59_05955 [Bacteroidota bacterium]